MFGFRVRIWNEYYIIVHNHDYIDFNNIITLLILDETLHKTTHIFTVHAFLTAFKF